MNNNKLGKCLRELRGDESLRSVANRLLFISILFCLYKKTLSNIDLTTFKSAMDSFKFVLFY